MTLMNSLTGTVVFTHQNVSAVMSAAGDFDGDSLSEYALPDPNNNRKIDIFSTVDGSREQSILAPGFVGSATISDLELVAGPSGPLIAASWPDAFNGNGVILTFDPSGVLVRNDGLPNEGLGRVLASGNDVNFPTPTVPGGPPSGPSIQDIVALTNQGQAVGSARVTLDQTGNFQGQPIVLPAGQTAIDVALVGDITDNDHSEILVTTSANTAILFSGGHQAVEVVSPACPADVAFSLVASTSAIPGTNLVLTVTGAPPAVPATIFLGPPSTTGIPSGFGCNLMFADLSMTISVPVGNTTGAGTLTLPLAVGINLLGTDLGFQIVTLNGAMLDFSNGLSTLVGW